MKEFILSRTALNYNELCRLINWAPSSFNQWMKGNRGIPQDKALALHEILKGYGYTGEY